MSLPALEPVSDNRIYLARQPILDRDLQVVAYEILFRNNASDTALFLDGNEATSRLIVNTFVEMDIDSITVNKQAFINLTRDFLIGKLPLPFPPGKVVLEILEEITADEESMAGARKLVEQGYTLALDDFVLSEKNHALVSMASIVKIDIRLLDEAELREHVQFLQQFPVKLLAEKVETQTEYELCRNLGFSLFQGFFFSKPLLLSGKQLTPNSVSLLKILAKLQAPDCSMKELEDIIAYDVAISYKLMKIINSSFYGMKKKVESIQHAIVLLGLSPLKSWVTLISLSMIDDKPRELINMTLIRAKLCENLTSHFGCKADAAFLVGLFSLLDVLLDQDKESLLASLPLAEEILGALMRLEGSLGALLNFVIHYERGEWVHHAQYSLTEENVVAAYLEAIQWNDDISRQLV